jgi:hypothetical protein
MNFGQNGTVKIFNLKIYKLFNKDLCLFTDKELETHYYNHGKYEDRIFNSYSLMKKHELLLYFDYHYYVENNKDLIYESESECILDFILNEINNNRKISKKLKDFKDEKKKILDEILIDNSKTNFLSEDDKKLYKIGICQSESSNEWGDSSEIAKLISENSIVVNIGAGYRKNIEQYYSLPNVINTEIFNYPTTDILCDGNNLPFKDNSVDLVLSLAVLEHVKDPWNHAVEIIRILKPGGKIFVDVPFLQPYHGYPYHYYNMTTEGLRNLFGKSITVIHHNIEPWQLPIYTLTWFLGVYSNDLKNETKEKFMSMTVKDILKNGNNLNLDYVDKLSLNTREILACGTTLLATKN